MVREKDKLWEYVKVLEDNRLMCKFCERTFAGGITRFRYHLSGLKRHDIHTCPKVPEIVRIAAYEGIRASNSGRETEIISTSPPKKKAKAFHQPKVVGAYKKGKSEADKLLARFLSSNNLPLDVSRIPHLGGLLHSVAEVGRSYELPTYSELQSQQILDANKEIEEYIGKTKKLFPKTGGWIFLEKVRVSEEGMTFHSFKSNVCRIIESLGPEHVVQVILDDSKDCMMGCFTDFRGDNFFPEVMKVIQRKYAWIYVSRCVNGELEEILLHICSEVCWIREIIQLAKLIFKYMCKHNSTLQLLRKQQHPRNKEYSCSEKSKIANEFSMLNSILQVEKELQTREGEGFSSENDVATVVQKAIYSTDFWSNGKKVVQVLQPLFQVLELVDRYESTTGYLNEALKRAEEAFKLHLDGKDWIEVLRAWRSRVVQPIHEVAEWEALLKEVQLYRRKDSDLFNEEAMTMLKTVHPRKWWDCCGDRYPILQKIAIRVLSQTCSTSLCDHITFRQNRFVNESTMNRNMMEKFSAFKSKNLKLIDLERISGLPVCSQELVQKFLEDLDESDNNINDEETIPLTSEYRNLNRRLNLELGHLSTLPECNSEPEQRGSMNLKLVPVSTLPECDPEPEQRGCLNLELGPEQRDCLNWELGHVSTLPECDPEPEQHGCLNLQLEPVSTPPECDPEPEQRGCLNLQLEPEQCDRLNLELGPASTLPECNPEPEQCGRLNLELRPLSTLPECNPEPEQRALENVEVGPDLGLGRYVVEECPFSHAKSLYYFLDDLWAAPKAILHL